MIGAHHAVARIHSRALDDRQNIALHSLAGYVRAVPRFAPGNLVDFVDEKNSHLLDALKRDPCHVIHIHETILFFLN